MFIGEYSHSIDDKGRLAIPAKFRRAFEKGAVITRGLDHCLSVYPREEWQALAEKLAALPVSRKENRAYARLTLAGAWDAALDSQGRVILPEYLRQYATLAKHVTLAGLYNRVEIWDEDAWHTYRAAAETDSEQIAESLADAGV